MTAALWLLLSSILLCARRPGLAVIRLPELTTRSGASGQGRSLAGRWRAASNSRLLAAWSGSRRGLILLVMVAGAGVLGAALGRLGVGLAAGCLVAAGLSAGVSRLRERTAARTREALVAAVAMLEVELAAGSREAAGLAAAAQVGGTYAPIFARAARTATAGGDVAAVLGTDSDLLPLVGAWRLRARCGAALRDVLADVRRDFELRLARQRDVNAAFARPRSSAFLLAGLPVLGIALGIGLGADPAGFLLGSPAGSVVLLVGVLADLLGLFWIRYLIRRALR